MTERDWWETAREELERAKPEERAAAAERLVADYFALVEGPRRAPADVRKIVADIGRHLEGELPPFVVVSAPDQSGLTPDELLVEPAWNEFEVERLWDIHDGRSLGTMVVAVYRLDRDGPLPVYARDRSWGMLGRPGERRPANPDAETDRL